MDNSQQVKAFAFFGILLSAVAICLLSQMLLPSGWIEAATVLSCLMSLIGLAALQGISPFYNPVGKVALGVIGITLTVFGLCWFTTWQWVGVFTLVLLAYYFVVCAIAVRTGR